jgi:hypothetical protein
MPGGVEGRLWKETVRNGRSGTPETVKELTYMLRTGY